MVSWVSFGLSWVFWLVLSLFGDFLNLQRSFEVILRSCSKINHNSSCYNLIWFNSYCCGYYDSDSIILKYILLYNPYYSHLIILSFRAVSRSGSKSTNSTNDRNTTYYHSFWWLSINRLFKNCAIPRRVIYDYVIIT